MADLNDDEQKKAETIEKFLLMALEESKKISSMKGMESYYSNYNDKGSSDYQYIKPESIDETNMFKERELKASLLSMSKQIDYLNQLPDKRKINDMTISQSEMESILKQQIKAYSEILAQDKGNDVEKKLRLVLPIHADKIEQFIPMVANAVIEGKDVTIPPLDSPNFEKQQVAFIKFIDSVANDIHAHNAEENKVDKAFKNRNEYLDTDEILRKFISTTAALSDQERRIIEDGLESFKLTPPYDNHELNEKNARSVLHANAQKLAPFISRLPEAALQDLLLQISAQTNQPNLAQDAMKEIAIARGTHNEPDAKSISPEKEKEPEKSSPEQKRTETTDNTLTIGDYTFTRIGDGDVIKMTRTDTIDKKETDPDTGVTRTLKSQAETSAHLGTEKEDAKKIWNDLKALKEKGLSSNQLPEALDKILPVEAVSDPVIHREIAKTAPKTDEEAVTSLKKLKPPSEERELLPYKPNGGAQLWIMTNPPILAFQTENDGYSKMLRDAILKNGLGNEQTLLYKHNDRLITEESGPYIANEHTIVLRDKLDKLPMSVFQRVATDEKMVKDLLIAVKEKSDLSELPNHHDLSLLGNVARVAGNTNPQKAAENLLAAKNNDGRTG